MKNNVCLWILVIIAIVLIVWWLSQPTFMRIRPENMGNGVGDAKKGCCKITSYMPRTTTQYRWMTHQECDEYAHRDNVSSSWHPDIPENRCH